MLNPLWLPVRALVLAASFFALTRALLLLLYPDYFASLSWEQAFSAWLYGWRFDMAIAVLGMAVFLCPLLWPWDYAWRQSVARLSLLMSLIAVGLLWALQLADTVYFGEVYRHAGRELLLLTQDYGLLVELALGSRWLISLSALLVMSAFAWLWWHWVVQPSARTSLNRGVFKQAGFALALFLLLLISGRGLVLSGKPLGLVDAYAAGDERQAALALNGAFALVHTWRRGQQQPQPLAYFTAADWDEALSQLEAQSAGDPFVRSWLDDTYPASQPNLVIVLLESWSADYIDSLSGSSYGATPFFDQLVASGRVWPQAFAAGQRSIEGIQASLTSVPLLPQHPVMGWGMEQNRMTRLATLLDDTGYQSVMVQTSKRRSFYLDGIAAALGFDAYFGQEDLPLLRDYPGEVPRFGWDYEGMMFLADYLAARAEEARPSVAFLFTGTTHEPFPDPGAEFHLYPHDAGSEGAYLNTLRYSDWALSEMMQRLEALPSYQNTIFVFMADHVLRAQAQDLHASFRIPLVIYTPDGRLAPGRETRYASQYDLLPTLMTLMGRDEPIASYGRSLLRPLSGPEGVVVQRGEWSYWLSPLGWLSVDPQGRVRSEGDLAASPAHRSQLEHWLKARMQLADQRLRANAWLPREAAYHPSAGR